MPWQRVPVLLPPSRPSAAARDSAVPSWAPFLPGPAGLSQTTELGRGQAQNQAPSPLSPTPGALEVLPVLPGAWVSPRPCQGEGEAPAWALLFIFFSWKKQELRSRLPSWGCGPVALSPWPCWGIRQHPKARAVPRGWRHRSVRWLLEPCGHRCLCWRGTGVLGTGRAGAGCHQRVPCRRSAGCSDPTAQEATSWASGNPGPLSRNCSVAEKRSPRANSGAGC